MAFSQENDGGIVKKQNFQRKQSLSSLRVQLPLHKGAFEMFNLLPWFHKTRFVSSLRYPPIFIGGYLLFVRRKPPAVLVVPKSFSFARIIYPSEVREQVAFSCGRAYHKRCKLQATWGTTKWWMRSCLGIETPHPTADERLPPSPTGEG